MHASGYNYNVVSLRGGITLRPGHPVGYQLSMLLKKPALIRGLKVQKHCKRVTVGVNVVSR